VLTVWLGLGAASFSVYPVGFFVTTVGFVLYVVASGCSALRTHLARWAVGTAMATAVAS